MLNLRRTLASIALAAPLAGCPLGECPPAPPRVEDTIVIVNPTDIGLAPLVDDCKMTSDCEPLCREVYKRKYAKTADYLDTCELLADPVTGKDAVHYVEEYYCVGGRRPAGYRRGRPCGNAVGAYLAQQADLEAASVRAFGDLHADLRALGAPASLQRAAIAAAADEVRHARTCEHLARRHGVDAVPRPVGAAARRSRRALAIDNAVEGCVRETYGAVVAGYQARAASDPAIRRAMQQIAGDEAKHAALSWRLHRWLLPRLSPAERDEVHAAAARERAALHDAVATEEPAELQRVVGIPSAAAATAMLADLDARVWHTI